MKKVNSISPSKSDQVNFNGNSLYHAHHLCRYLKLDMESHKPEWNKSIHKGIKFEAYAF